MVIDPLRQNLTSAVRSLLGAPGFATVTVVTLALGIGANTAIFSVVNAVILQPLPYPRPGQLMFVSSRFPDMGFDQFWVSPPEYFELTEINRSFAVVGAFTTSEVNLAALDRPRRVTSGNVNAELLEALAVPPARGRWFRRDETRVNGPPLAILSHETWQSAFAGRADIVGRLIDVDGERREVIGVMAPGFDVMDSRVEIWLPLQLNPQNRQNRAHHFLYLIGRLKDGVTRGEAEAELATLVLNWGERVGARQHVFTPTGHALQMEPVQDEIVGSARRAIWVLQAAVGFVLLIACANLASLLLARAETRQREFAVRSALGAGRGRLLAQFVTEGTLLSLLGAGLGAGLAALGVGALVAAYPDSLPRAASIGVDPAVLGVTLVAALSTGVVFGFAPLVHLSGAGLVARLREGTARGSTTARHRVRRALVLAEVALAVMLVAGAGLMARTVLNLTRVDAGFNRMRLVTFALDLPNATYPRAADIVGFYHRLLDRLRTLSGVQGVTSMTGLPPLRRVNANDTDIEDYVAPKEGPFENVDYYQTVGDGYFDTLGIPIVEGRGFEARDAEAAPVVVINETMARTFWSGHSAIGARVRPSLGQKAPWFTIVGVARDVKQGGVDRKTGTELYFHAANLYKHLDVGSTTMNVVLRSSLPVAALAPVIDAAVRDADASLPVIRLRTMDEVFRQSLGRPRLVASLLGGFAGLALLMAALGTYGMWSYIVTERRREIGIRMALGAARTAVLRSIVVQGLKLAAIGVLAGLGAALASTRVMASLLFGVGPADPATLVAVAVVIVLVAAAACGVPAFRATRVDPVVALRDE